MIASVVIASGECSNLPNLLKELEADFEEVILIDNGLSPEVLRNFSSPKIKLFKRSEKDFASLRNFALLKCKNQWVFFIDADEKFEKGLLEEVKKKVKDKEYVAFYIKRREFFYGKEVRFGEVWKARRTGIVRLVKKGAGEWKGKVHEVFVAKGKFGRLKNSLLHHSHSSVSEFLRKVNFYSTLRAKELYERKVRFNFIGILFFPFLKFIYTYFFLLGFLDGFAGFLYSFMMSFHSFLVRAKLYQYWKFEG